MTMQLQFSHQDYQKKAVDAVVKVFDGQPLAKGEFSLAGQNASVDYAPDGTIGNALKLSDAQLLANVQAVQKANFPGPDGDIKPGFLSTELQGDTLQTLVEGVAESRICPHLSIEMETGTGKTYTFIKTMYELNEKYGFKKFVVVVPSVAIREGTMKNLEVTRSHFSGAYGNVPCVVVQYDSNKLSELRHFAQSDALSVLVINVDSFTKDNNKINQKGERAFAPIEYIRAVNPIVIVDEPQNFETPVRRSALLDLNPLCTLRYSATHKNHYNLLYSLSPVQAYDLGLVKQIEVDGVQADADHNDAFVELVRVEAKASSMTATVRIDVNEKTGVKRKEIKLKLGEDLFDKSKGRDIYQDGYVLNSFLSDAEIEFSGGRVLKLNQAQAGLTDDVMRFQIERTVAAHFAKLKNVQAIGVKVLSLFFIDKVANYRAFDADGNPSLGKFGVWFEEAFNKYAGQARYRGLIPHAAAAVHDGYFSGDKKGKGTKAKTVWVDTSGTVAKDDSTYQLIMKDKERLLSEDVPLQFIFSHSALREGWDNPNVFQICTLNETKSSAKKRQEIGRGLRLCVNKHGERVLDKRVNVLTVIPNESYEAFAKALQQEIEEETGETFERRIKDARAKAWIAPSKKLTAEDEALFKAIWDKISYQTKFSVELDTPILIAQCIQALGDTDQYPKVRQPKIRAERAKIVMRRDGVHGVHVGTDDSDARVFGNTVPDVYAYIQNRVHLSRTSIFAILDGSGRMEELLINPQAFLDIAIAAIRRCLHTLMVSGIKYETIGRRYEMSLLKEELEAYLSSVYPPADDDTTTPLAKTLLQAQRINTDKEPVGEPFACVLSDSDTESRFAHDCSVHERVRFFFKLPSRFKIPTPLGHYNPDWAVVLEGDTRVYFVAETKSTTVQADRREAENLKIICAREHFGLGDEVFFDDVTKLSELLA